MRNKHQNIIPIVLLLLTLLSTTAWAQQKRATGTIQGYVRTATDSTTLQNVDVFVPNSTRIANTNKKGQYTLTDLKPGKYRLAAFLEGYKTQLIEVQVKAGQTTTANFNLEKLSQVLEEVVINDEATGASSQYLRAVEGYGIYEAKKSELIRPDQLNANLATNNSRQVFAKVPGLNIWESDGAGLQLGIGARGLDPNRTAHFNVRQNGYDISADALGYPESYYTPPVEALERVELVRGAASLQYGSQFGGMLNFTFKEGPADRKLAITSRQNHRLMGLL